MDTQQINRVASVTQAIISELRKTIVGQDDILTGLMASLYANGHCLLVGVPGLAKTLLVQSLGASLSMQFSRIQFTPDLMPSDILGSEVIHENNGRMEFQFRQGPVFTNLLLADEINRTPPKTQSALLEAMQERRVTIAGQMRPLPQPFLVVATQNPIEQEGTYPLPEAQLDRFCMRITLGYPDHEQELLILKDQTLHQPLLSLKPVMSTDQLRELQGQVKNIYVEDSVLDYLVRITNRTRKDGRLRLGASPRGALDLRRAAQARALLAGRDHVRPEDIKALAGPMLAHRLLIDPKAGHSGMSDLDIIADMLRAEPVPG
jgi:MoxR-like ATPase